MADHPVVCPTCNSDDCGITWGEDVCDTKRPRPVIPASSLSPEALELQRLLNEHADHPAVEGTGGIIRLDL